MIRSRSNSTTALSALVIACAMAVISAPPVAAQSATSVDCKGCIKSKQIKDNKLKSRDIKDGELTGTDMSANISLGTGSDDGDLSVKSTVGTPTVSLDGASGTVTNSLSGDGLVKAWAQINADGTVQSCYRCNMSASETQRVDTGLYEVDFTPLGTDIRGRPRSVTSDGGGTTLGITQVTVSDRFAAPGPPPVGGGGARR